MKKLFITYSLLLFSVLCHAQTTKSTWGKFETLYKDGSIHVEIAYRIENTCVSQKNTKYKARLNGTFKDYDQYVTFKHEYIDCNGNTIVKNSSFMIGKNGASEQLIDRFDESMDYVFESKQVLRKFYDVKVMSYALTGVVNQSNSTYVQPVVNHEKNLWQKVLQNPTIDNLNNYTYMYPNGTYNWQVPKMLQTAYYNRAYSNDISVSSCLLAPFYVAANYWEEYLTKFPNTLYSELAETRIFLYNNSDAIKNIGESKKYIQSSLDFESKYPYGKCVPEFKVKREKLASILLLQKRANASVYLTNLVVPGLGHRACNKLLNELNHQPLIKKRMPIITTFLIIGGLGIGTKYAISGNNLKNKYQNSTNPAEWDGYLKLSNADLNTASLFLTSACIIWAVDYLNLVAKKRIIKRKIKNLY